MSDKLFYFGCAIVVVALFAGFLAGASFYSVDGELDKICYEHDPGWSYKTGSALYWNQSLTLDCVGPVVVENPVLGNVTEKQVQTTLKLEEVNAE